MRLKKESIRSLARAIQSHLVEQGAVRLEPTGKKLDQVIERVIADDFSVEDRLDAEVRKILDSYESEIAKGDVDPHQMFLMIKKQLAKDKGLIL